MLRYLWSEGTCRMVHFVLQKHGNRQSILVFALMLSLMRMRMQRRCGQYFQ
jgi:hypothetical protein